MTVEAAEEEFRRAEELKLQRPSVSTRQLRVFAEVYRERSVTDAADILLLSQPTVSRALKTLEDRLQSVLFERTKTGLSPTPAGERLYPHAVNALREIDQALHELRGVHEEAPLAVGTTPELLMLMAPAVRGLTHGITGLDHLEASTGDELMSALRSRTLDVVIVPALGDQIPDWAHSIPVRRIRFALHQPEDGLRSELLALPPAGSWERAILTGITGHEPAGPAFEATGGGVSKRLLREGFSVYLPLGCADDVQNVEVVGPVHEVMVHAITRDPVRPGSLGARLIDELKVVADPSV